MTTKETTGRASAAISVRQAGLADADRIAPLFDGYRQFYGQEPDFALAAGFIHERLALQESVIFLAEDAEGKVLGFTQLYPGFTSVGARRTWTLNDLFVLPAARGCGVGKILMEAARKHAAATGASRIDLSTAHDNPAQKLYEAQGYVREEGFYHYSVRVD